MIIKNSVVKIQNLFMNQESQPIKWNPDNYFHSYTYEKIYLVVHFTKGCFYQFGNRKVVGLMFNYYLLTGDTSQVSIFFFTQDKND